jgi:hypothetical protein
MWMKTAAALTGSPGWALSLARMCPAGAPNADASLPIIFLTDP